MTPYVIEIRAFNDGIAFRYVIPGEAKSARVPDEYTRFILPAGSNVWFHGLDGHYEAEYVRRGVAEIAAGQWAGPPVTVQIPLSFLAGGRYRASIIRDHLENSDAVIVEAGDARQSDVLTITMIKGGGFVARFTPGKP